MSTELQPINGAAPPAAMPVHGGLPAVFSALEDLKAFRTFVQHELKADLDFGKIPGAGDKPTLFQPGAQKICFYFNCYPDFEVQTTELGDGHVEYRVKAKLVNRASGNIVGSGLGSCSTKESRHRYRNAARTCPECGQATIIKGKEEYGGGWLCWAKKGGCGTKFDIDDPDVANQATGQVENPNPHDQRNTALKMAVKRALVAAALCLGCASEMYTQDIEDTFDLRASEVPNPEPREASQPRDPEPEPQQRRRKEPKEKPVLKSLDNLIERFLSGWSRFEPPKDKDEDRRRQHRLANAAISRAIEAGIVEERTVLKPAEAGKAPARDPGKVWDCLKWLWRNEREWLINESRAYLMEKKREAEKAARPRPASKPLPAGKGEAYEDDLADDRF